MNSEKISSGNQSNIRFLLITANTGTVFEKSELLTPWVTEFANLIHEHPSDFIALHCQEIGGKDYERHMQVIDQFTKSILQIPEIANEYTRCRIYFDSDYTSQDTFTALGSAYFIRQSLPIQQWNFTTSSFEPVNSRQIYSGNLAHAQTIHQEKFPREFFSESKWSRKGFTQTRWSINGFAFDMINIHLFHDASNIVAVEQTPSTYSQCRKNALEFTLKRIRSTTSDASVPFAIFGDFNFRLDGHRFLQHITDNRNGSIDRINYPNSDDVSKLILRDAQNSPIMTIGKKEFNLHDDHDSYFGNEFRQFHGFDFEISSFTDQLYENEKTFPPSYPYSEESDEARLYLRVRCPAWCDRICLSHSLNAMVDTQASQPTYGVVGTNVCMGDHKPVYLALTIRSATGSSTPPSPLKSVLSPLSSFSSNSIDQFPVANMHLCETIASTSDTNNNTTNNNTSNDNNNCNETKSSVTVMRNHHSDMLADFILNDVPLSASDIAKYNVHDYALFIEPSLVPWLSQLRQRSMKTSHNSTKLWAKVRAVTYMTGLGHRTGSWYSDDRTEKSPADDASSISLELSDNNDKNILTNMQFNDLDDINRPDLVIPLRRSFSSNAYVKHDEMYPMQMTRSSSTTQMSTVDDMPCSSHVEQPSTLVPSQSPIKSPSPPRSSSRFNRFLHCTIL